MLRESDRSQEVLVPAAGVELDATLAWPPEAQSVVLFAHGSGSSHRSPRNHYVADVLNQAGIATLLMDLLSPEADRDHERRFDIGLLTTRLIAATEWILAKAPTQPVAIGYFGANSGTAAALCAASVLDHQIDAIVSRSGRPDLASKSVLARIKAPTLLIVGGLDTAVIEFNDVACALLHCEKELVLVPGATHLFEEPGALQQAAQLSAQWFQQHFDTSRSEQR